MITFEQFRSIGEKYGYSVAEKDSSGASLESPDRDFIRGAIAHFKPENASSQIIDDDTNGYAVCNTEPVMLEFARQKPYVWVQSCSGSRIAEDTDILEDCFGSIDNKLRNFRKIKRKDEIDRL